MPFYWMGPWADPYFTLPVRTEGYLFLSLYLIILAFVFYHWRGDFHRLGGRGIFLLLGLVLAAALLSNAFKFHPESEEAVLVPSRPDLPLLAGLPTLLAASLLTDDDNRVSALCSQKFSYLLSMRSTFGMARPVKSAITAIPASSIIFTGSGIEYNVTTATRGAPLGSGPFP